MTKKFKYIVLILLLSASAYSSANPFVLFGRAAYSIVRIVANSLGALPANDPRLAITAAKIAVNMGSKAASGLTVAENAYLGTLFAGMGLSLANGDLMSWASNGLLTYQSADAQGSNPSPVGSTNNCITVSGSVYCTTELGETEFLSSLINSSSAKDLIPSTECEACFITQVYYPMYCAGGTCLLAVALSYNHPEYGVQPYGQESISFSSGSIPRDQSCQNTKDGSCFAFPIAGTTLSDLTPDQLFPLLTPTQLGQAIPADVVARLIDQAWQDVSAVPGYGGIPYTFSNPVTASAVTAASPGITVGDLLAPNSVSQTGTGAPTIDLPAQTEGTIYPETDPNAQKLDLGVDPVIGAPSVTPPSIESILSPIFDMLPDYKNANFQDGHGVCTPLEFNAMGLYKVTTVHCDLFEQVKPIIHLIMSLIWLFVAIRIVLEA